jgi:hypothetical protein
MAYPLTRRKLLHTRWAFLLLALIVLGCDMATEEPPLTDSRPAAKDTGLLQDSTGFIPLNDLGTGTYLGFEGGLYPQGSNTLPDDHSLAGLLEAAQVQPRNALGQPDPAGKYVLLSIGMSQPSEEFCKESSALPPCHDWSFMGQVALDTTLNHTALVLVNGARGGKDAEDWDSATDREYDRVRDEELLPLGLTEQQVQVVWVKLAKGQVEDPVLPAVDANAYVLEQYLGNVMRSLRSRYPYLKLAFVTSRSYGGYASPTSASPEPYAYESAFAYKWLIEAQLNQMRTGVVDQRAGSLNYLTGEAPWIAWGPYWWADGLKPRADGLFWTRAMFVGDGAHPSQEGEEQTAALLMDFFKTSSHTVSWFLKAPTPEAWTFDLVPGIDPVEIPASGGSFTYDLVVTNGFSDERTTQYWVIRVTPDNKTTTVVAATTVTLSPDQTFRQTITAKLRANNLPGSYLYTGYVGTYPDQVAASDVFIVTKLAALHPDQVSGQVGHHP